MTKLSWAHPEFGSVLASSSFDRTVKIWEETPADNSEQPQANGASAVAASGPGTRWVNRAMLADSKGTVRDVEFAPHQFGLKLVRPSSYCSPHPAPTLQFFFSTGYNSFRQSSARVRVPRSARSHKLDPFKRDGHSGASFHVDIASTYLCGAYPNSDIRDPSRRRVTRCERVATATTAASCPTRRRKPRGRRWVVGLMV